MKMEIKNNSLDIKDGFTIGKVNDCLYFGSCMKHQGRGERQFMAVLEAFSDKIHFGRFYV